VSSAIVSAMVDRIFMRRLKTEWWIKAEGTCIRNQTFVQCRLWNRITFPSLATGCICGVRRIRSCESPPLLLASRGCDHQTLALSASDPPQFLDFEGRADLIRETARGLFRARG